MFFVYNQNVKSYSMDELMRMEISEIATLDHPKKWKPLWVRYVYGTDQPRVKGTHTMTVWF